jgi:Lipase (class 3)
MKVERAIVEPPHQPFPIYADPIEGLRRADPAEEADRDPAAAHVLAVLSGYAYADTATVAMMAGRLGMEGSACVQVSQTVDAMHVFSTAYLLQSRCGRVAVLCYRGTEPANFGNWLGDADVGSDAMEFEGERLTVHAGFHRNVLATRRPILDLLHAAARGESLGRPGAPTDHPLEALYVTGHSLGGAMAALFALRLAADGNQPLLLEKLRAIYTFGQPLAAGGPLPVAAGRVARRLFRHVNARDIVPSLPFAAWGPLQHFGHEFRYADGRWTRCETVTAQLESFRAAPRAVLALFAPAKKRDALPYTIADHGPHHYIAALRPRGSVTEFGDRT